MNHLKNSIYHWQGKNPQGQMISGQMAAFSMNLVMANLQKKGIRLISVQKKRVPYFQKKITPFDIILFFRQLSTLLLAGISISQAIQLVGQNSQHSKLLKITSSIKEDIANGNGLAHAMQKFPTYFDGMTTHLILAGEKSGTLDVMLERIAEHREQLFLLKTKIKQALFYPILILLVAMIVTIVMLIFVVPRFTDLFQNMHAKLPTFTLYVIGFANFLINDWSVMLLLFVIIIGFIYSAKYFSSVKLILDTFILKLPIAGISLQKFILTHWMRSLTTLIAAGIPITEALKILTHFTGNILYKNAMQALYFNILAGKQLYFAMQNNKLFPPMMTQMIQIGEESGTLEKMLTKVADFYQSDLDRMIGHLSRLLEPLIMVILGVVIGGLVIAMYLPIFKLGAVI